MSDGTGPRTTTIAWPCPDSTSTNAGPRARRTRTTSDDLRLLERRSSKLVLGLLAAVVAGALAASVLIIPVKAWLNQREELAHREAQLERLETANERLEADVARLETDEGIASAVREELGAVNANETVYRIVMDPELLALLPEGWLYPTITALIAVRAGIAAPILPVPITGPAITGPAITGPAITGPAITGPAITAPPNSAEPSVVTSSIEQPGD